MKQDRHAVGREPHVYFDAGDPQIAAGANGIERVLRCYRLHTVVGDQKWSATVLDLEDFNFAATSRRQCGNTIGRFIEDRCNYAVQMAVVRTDANHGRIVDAQRVRVTDPFGQSKHLLGWILTSLRPTSTNRMQHLAGSAMAPCRERVEL